MNGLGKTLEIQLSSLQPKLKGLLFSCLMGKQDKTCVENFACFTMDQKFESYSKIFTSEISQLDLEMFSVWSFYTVDNWRVEKNTQPCNNRKTFPTRKVHGGFVNKHKNNYEVFRINLSLSFIKLSNYLRWISRRL